MVGMKNPIDRRDTQDGKVSENRARTEVDQERARSALDDVNVAGILEYEEVVRDLTWLRIRRKRSVRCALKRTLL